MGTAGSTYGGCQGLIQALELRQQVLLRPRTLEEARKGAKQTPAAAAGRREEAHGVQGRSSVRASGAQEKSHKSRLANHARLTNRRYTVQSRTVMLFTFKCPSVPCLHAATPCEVGPVRVASLDSVTPRLRAAIAHGR